MNKSIFNIGAALLISCIVASCSSGDDESNSGKILKKEKVSGISQKGPFMSGTVKLFELDKNYERTGTPFSGNIKDKSGSYEITGIELALPYVEMEATGKYINEITNTESENTITLKAIADIANKDKVNINVFTHLEHGKVLSLLKKGLSFAEAKKQAFEEVLKELGIDISFSGKNSENMSLQADSVLLLASVLLQVGRSESELRTLLSTLTGIDKVKEGMEQALEDFGTAKDNVQGSATIIKGTFKDNRDGKDYGWVKIGTQTWMAENLNYNVPDNDTDVCYDNDPAYCEIYGRLYNWETAMTVCPDAWHLPSNEEWIVMLEFVKPNCFTYNDIYCNYAGTILKSSSYWKESGNAPLGTDDFGFSALPGGYLNGSRFSTVEEAGYWWSTTERSEGSTDAYRWRMVNNQEYTDNDYRWNKKYLISVRCVKTF